MHRPESTVPTSWATLLVALLCGCAAPAVPTTATLPAPVPARVPATSPSPTMQPPVEREVLATAHDLVGTPYRYGGESPASGFDCSGFVGWVYARSGIELPRTAREMAGAGRRVPARRALLRPGDLLFFAERGRVTHVAIYVGGSLIVHASSGRGIVRYDDLDSARGRWFRRHVVSARRVLGAGAADAAR